MKPLPEPPSPAEYDQLASNIVNACSRVILAQKAASTRLRSRSALVQVAELTEMALELGKAATAMIKTAMDGPYEPKAVKHITFVIAKIEDIATVLESK